MNISFLFETYLLYQIVKIKTGLIKSVRNNLKSLLFNSIIHKKGLNFTGNVFLGVRFPQKYLFFPPLKILLN